MKEEKMPLIMKHLVWLNLAWQWRYLTYKTGFLFIGTHCISQNISVDYNQFTKKICYIQYFKKKNVLSFFILDTAWVHVVHVEESPQEAINHCDTERPESARDPQHPGGEGEDAERIWRKETGYDT